MAKKAIEEVVPSEVDIPVDVTPTDETDFPDLDDVLKDAAGELTVEESALIKEAAESAISEAMQINEMTPDEINSKFGISISEAVGILRHAITESKSVHSDKMFSLLEKIEKTSNY